MEECEKRRARRRGCQTLAQAFAKGKRARTDNGPAAGEDLLREAEDENLGQDGGVNLEVGGGILDQNANIGAEINNRDIQDNYNFGEVNANVKEVEEQTTSTLNSKVADTWIAWDQFIAVCRA